MLQSKFCRKATEKKKNIRKEMQGEGADPSSRAVLDSSLEHFKLGSNVSDTVDIWPHFSDTGLVMV
jgi:hypothetical protein